MRHFNHAFIPHVSNILRGEVDPIVQNGLALTPARMLELTRQGFSISAQNSRMLANVPVAPFAHMDIPPEYQRGFDPADGYQMMKEVHEKVRSNRLNWVRSKRSHAQQEGE